MLVNNDINRSILASQVVENYWVELPAPIVVWLKRTVVLFVITIVVGPVTCTIILFSILDKFPVPVVIDWFSKGWVETNSALV